MQKHSVRGASVCSSCVLNAKRGSILQSVIDCLFIADHAFCVRQYSVVLPGRISRCVTKKTNKLGCLRRGGCECLLLRAAPPARRLSPPYPLPSCYATTSSPPPPLPPPPHLDPVAPSPDQPLTGPPVCFYAKKKKKKKSRGWGPLQHAKPDLGMSTPPRPWQSRTLSLPPPRFNFF